MTIEEFRRIPEEWKACGLTLQKYCESTGFSESRFYYWKAKLKESSLPSMSGGFIPVRMSGRSSSACSVAGGKALCEVAYPNGIVVRVTSDMTLDQLRQMVTLLC